MAKARDNLVPQAHVLTLEEQSAGGKASGEARRKKATMLSVLEKMLDEEYIQKGKPTGKTYRELATLGLIKGAVKGDSRNFRVILETLGELNQADNKENGVLTDLVEALNNAKKS